MRYNSSNQTFRYKNHTFHYCIDSHNTRGSLTERIVEIPLLDFFLQNTDRPIEIGCVSPYYFDVSHNIYDLSDSHPACKNIDARYVDLKNRNVLCISTIEHFDMNDYDKNSIEPLDPIQYLIDLIKVSNKFLVTIPLGYNARLTKFILTHEELDINFIARFIDERCWKQVKKSELTPDQLSYDTHFWCANSIAILENIL